MKNKLKQKKLSIFSITFALFGLLLISLGISSSIILKKDMIIYEKDNINLEKAISKDDFKKNYTDIDKNLLNPVLYSTFNEAVENSKYYPTSFIGKLTHYGPDCVLCGGKLGCNGQDARNGNIWYEDSEYGKIRIVASSKTLVCGSIIRINIDEYDNMYAIVLDRGVGTGVIDLLKESEISNSPVRTLSKVKFDIIRYGY